MWKSPHTGPTAQQPLSFLNAKEDTLASTPRARPGLIGLSSGTRIDASRRPNDAGRLFAAAEIAADVQAPSQGSIACAFACAIYKGQTTDLALSLVNTRKRPRSVFEDEPTTAKHKTPGVNKSPTGEDRALR